MDCGLQRARRPSTQGKIQGMQAFKSVYVHEIVPRPARNLQDASYHHVSQGVTWGACHAYRKGVSDWVPAVLPETSYGKPVSCHGDQCAKLYVLDAKIVRLCMQMTNDDTRKKQTSVSLWNSVHKRDTLWNTVLEQRP